MPGKYIETVVAGCVDYLYGTATRHHQTGFIFTINRFEPTRPNDVIAIKVGEQLPPNRIALIKYAFGGFYAY